jgi:ABC-type uncharacterized transport system involved in gliding motility auxiliary subunit
MRGHWLRHAALLVAQVLLSLALFAVLLLLAERHNLRFDLTPTQRFVLSDEAVGVVQAIEQPIRVTAFYNSQDSQQRNRMQDLLQLFEQASRNFSYRLVDLDRSPALAKKYDISSFNTGAVEVGSDVRALKGIDQESITDALLRMTRTGQRTLCFLTGHGEHSPLDADERRGFSDIGKALEREGFEIRTLEMVPNRTEGEDCFVVVLAGPVQDFLPGELDTLADLLDDGAHVVAMVDPDAPQSLVEFLARYGVRAGTDVVVDERNRMYGADSFMPRVPIFDRGTFGTALDTAAVFSVARTVSATEESPEHVAVLLLAMTSPESWAHANGSTAEALDSEVRFRREVDEPGPLPVAVMVTAKSDVSGTRQPGTEEATMGRMIVFGDSDFVSNLYLHLLGNKDFFMSSIAVLAEEDELIAMRRRSMPRSSLSPISLTADQGRTIFWVAVVAQPASFAVLGTIIIWRRRRRSGR